MAFRSYQVCEFLGIGRSQLTAIVRKGKIPAIKGNHKEGWLYPKEALAKAVVKNEKWLRNFQNYEPTPQLHDSYLILKAEVEKIL